MNPPPADLRTLTRTSRIERLRARTLEEPRRLSIEQALLVTESYRQTDGEPRVLRRAKALAHVLRNIAIRIDPEELVVGNRAPGIRAGIVFPEAAVAWVERELDTLSSRPQDPFEVGEGEARAFRETILPYWRGKTLEDHVYGRLGEVIDRTGMVNKINQRDHAQGHIIPNVRTWLAAGPAGLRREAETRLRSCPAEQRPFYEAVAVALDGARDFMRRYAQLAEAMAEDTPAHRPNLDQIAHICTRLADAPPETFCEAVQSVWFLFVLLHAESNASSFSPGRLDQYLLPYLQRDRVHDGLSLQDALELLEALWIKFNQIVYMRNEHSARYFAGFPIGFNVCIGGQLAKGKDATNVLSCLCLKAQEHLLLPQPNLSVRLHAGSPQAFLEEATRVIGLGSGMPQVFNDESIVPALMAQGIAEADALDYAVVGCVELSTQGNCLGWSDAAMFNMVKALELAINNGRCLLTGRQLGPQTGCLSGFESFAEVEKAFETQMDYFVGEMIAACDVVDRIHADVLPSPLLSSVVDECLARGVDVTAGGAQYNLSGIQGIQVANVADSLAVLKQLVFDERSVDAAELLEALRTDFASQEALRLKLVKQAPKYGNDIAWVDALGARWAQRFAQKVARHTNARGGPYHTGFYTVSAHVPMGQNVGATPDGRHARQPLADGGLSAMYGRDERGPTALLNSVARICSMHGSNGTLLNMKFLPNFFEQETGIEQFVAMLRGLVGLKIHHAQFNVVRKEDLLEAKANPDAHRHLTIRVAGYTAYFTELAEDLQDEIIARTTYGG